MSLSILIESLYTRLAAASVNFKSLMINIKVMTNFGIELLTYDHVPGSNRDKTFVRIKSTQALKAHDPEKNSCPHRHFSISTVLNP